MMTTGTGNYQNRHVTERDPDGSWVEAKLTDEGVIVDRYDADGELIATFGQTYDEILPPQGPDPARPQRENDDEVLPEPSNTLRVVRISRREWHVFDVTNMDARPKRFRSGDEAFAYVRDRSHECPSCGAPRRTATWVGSAQRGDVCGDRWHGDTPQNHEPRFAEAALAGILPWRGGNR